MQHKIRTIPRPFNQILSQRAGLARADVDRSTSATKTTVGSLQAMSTVCGYLKALFMPTVFIAIKDRKASKGIL